MPDNKYWEVGTNICKAENIGKNLKKKRLKYHLFHKRSWNRKIKS